MGYSAPMVNGAMARKKTRIPEMNVMRWVSSHFVKFPLQRKESQRTKRSKMMVRKRAVSSAIWILMQMRIIQIHILLQLDCVLNNPVAELRVPAPAPRRVFS